MRHNSNSTEPIFYDISFTIVNLGHDGRFLFAVLRPSRFNVTGKRRARFFAGASSLRGRRGACFGTNFVKADVDEL